MNFKLKVYILVLLSCVLSISAFNKDNKNVSENFSGSYAIIKKPVIDMFAGFPICESKDIPSAPDQNCKKCSRTHQGLYGEKVRCFEDIDECVKVSFDSFENNYHNIVYGFDQDGKARDSFWIYKKDLVSVLELENKNILKFIPSNFYGQEPTVFLIYPFESKQLGLTFSFGTRFMRYKEKDKLNEQGEILEYAVIIPDYENNKVVIDYLPFDCACIEIKDQDNNQKRELFVKIINGLVDRVSKVGEGDEVIPYVWGGSSFFCTDNKGEFYQKDDVWYRKDKKGDICSGYDCSGFVMRMAKISGIDFPCKNTVMIEKLRKPLLKEDKLQDGYLIWIPGHVMIISNVGKNELIEARGYSSGYGCLHKIELGEIFDGIKTYEQLLEAYFGEKPLRLLDKKGEFQKEYKTFKIIKLI